VCIYYSLTSLDFQDGHGRFSVRLLLNWYGGFLFLNVACISIMAYYYAARGARRGRDGLRLNDLTVKFWCMNKCRRYHEGVWYARGFVRSCVFWAGGCGARLLVADDADAAD